MSLDIAIVRRPWKDWGWHHPRSLTRSANVPEPDLGREFTVCFQEPPLPAVTLRAGLIVPGEPNAASSSQPGRCVEGRGQAHPGSALQGPLWLSEEADGSPDPVVEGLGGVWSGWSGPWR